MRVLVFGFLVSNRVHGCLDTFLLDVEVQSYLMFVDVIQTDASRACSSNHKCVHESHILC